MRNVIERVLAAEVLAGGLPYTVPDICSVIEFLTNQRQDGRDPASLPLLHDDQIRQALPLLLSLDVADGLCRPGANAREFVRLVREGRAGLVTTGQSAGAIFFEAVPAPPDVAPETPGSAGRRWPAWTVHWRSILDRLLALRRRRS